MAIEVTKMLDDRFSAFSDPTRRAILMRLARGEATVAELGAPFALSQPAISKHLRVLEAAGLIETVRDRQRRPRRLIPEAVDELSGWLDSFRKEWTLRFDNLDRHLSQQNEEN